MYESNKYLLYDSYIITTPPASLPVSIAFAKEWMKLAPGTAEDVLVEFLIQTATFYAEKYLNRTLINTTFKTYRNCFAEIIELTRSPLASLTSFKYLKDDVLTDVDSNLYYLTEETDYSKIILKNDKEYPSDIDNRLQAIEIQFVAGYAADDSSWPVNLMDLRNALLNHISYLHENRGDCDNPQMLMDKRIDVIPATSKTIYDKYRLYPK